MALYVSSTLIESRELTLGLEDLNPYIIIKSRKKVITPMMANTLAILVMETLEFPLKLEKASIIKVMFDMNGYIIVIQEIFCPTAFTAIEFVPQLDMFLTTTIRALYGSYLC